MDDNPLKDLTDFDFELTDEAAEGQQPAPASAPTDHSPGVPGGAAGGQLDMDMDIEALEQDAADEMSELAREVKEFFVAFVKTLRASALYVQGNPLLHQFVDDLNKRLTQLWSVVENVNFTIHENEITWHKHSVYKGRLGGHENLAFQLYKDGIRRFELQPGVEETEIRQFIDVLRLARTLQSDQEDLLTLMWNADFKYVRYEYVDVLGDEPPLPMGGEDVDTTGELPMMPELELSPEVQAPTLREDFEPSLYFLDESEVAHLQQELLREWERTIKTDVTLAVLDQFELGDVARRGEILVILRQMLPRVLAEGDFGDAAFIINELKSIAEKHDDDAIAENVDQIVAELSQPLVVHQLVRVLEDGSIDPEGDELAILLNSLKPEAIEVLIQGVSTVTRASAREQLLGTLDRLASMSPDMMSRLVRAEDPRIAAEAAKIAARLKMSGAAEAIAGLLRRPSAEVRLAAVEALVALRTSIGGAPLMKALDDANRDVRVAAARGLSELKYAPGAKKLEEHVIGKELMKRDLTEQVAFFEAFALTAGDEGTRLLAKMLNGRRFLWVKYPSKMRACAARALGLVGGVEAADALTAAEKDKDAMVLSAVHATRKQS
jgi:HEAT repeat protein